MRATGYLAVAWVLAAALGAGAAVSADSPGASPYPTGAIPLSPEDYSRLPKLGKFRAWLPKRVDLSASFPLPGHQAAPDCVAWATAYAARSFLNGETLGHQPVKPEEQASPAFVYNRLRPAGSPCKTIYRLVDTLDILTTEGTVSVADFPEDLRNCPIPVPQTLRDQAHAFRLKSWRAIDREIPNDWRSPVVIDDIKGALARHEPVVFTMLAVPELFALKGDTVLHHTTVEKGMYHAMALVGYDEDRQAFRLINSWGQDWGDHGYAWVDYDTFKALVAEAYVMEAPTDRAAPDVAETAQQHFDTVLAKLPCSDVTATRAGGHLRVTGFGGGQESVTELKYAALALDPAVDWSVAVHPWPQCEAQLTLSGAISNGAGNLSLMLQNATGELTGGDPLQLRAGDKFGIRAETMPVHPYLTVVYLQADGSAVELYNGMPLPGADRRRGVNIGADGPGKVQFQVGPPYGSESIIAIASAQPLFGADRGEYATERQFLTSLRGKLATMAAGSVSAKVLRLRTRE